MLTEQDWLRASDPEPMLAALREAGKASQRKLRLFAAACCRRTWHLVADERLLGTVEAAEHFADGLATPQELQASQALARAARLDADAAYQASNAAAVITDPTAADTRRAAAWAAVVGGPAAAAAQAAIDPMADFFAARTAAAAAAHTLEYASHTTADAVRLRVRGSEKAEQCRLVRCIFGLLPFRPFPPTDPAWLAWNDGTVTRLAAAAYQERAMPSGQLDPTRLAVLADALEEAGCTEADLLGHLRGPGPHVRGCWVVDVVLGRS
jgi:hypothetical protein